MSSSYFEHDADIGIIGYGLIIEQSFEAAAHAVFAIITNIEAVHPRTVVALEFEESDLELALVVWLNLILAKAREFSMVFSHFYLQRQNDHWHAKATGEKWRDGLERDVEVNCALTNRQILTHLTLATFAGIYPQASLETLFDISHNTCKEEQHEVDGKTRWLYVHRK
ncbi:MAG: archease, partial [Nitrosomonas sp.]